MKLKTLAIIGALLASTSSYAGYLCSYTAYISDSNKYNSDGKSVVNGVNLQSAGQVLRQNRADIHRFGVGTFGDTSDCYFDDINHRSRIPTMLKKGSISKNTIRQIVTGNPLLTVDVYSTHLEVRSY